MTGIDIFNYLDYRSFLRDALAAAKRNGLLTGLRQVAAELELKSPGHITWILQGKRDLNPKRVPAMAKLLNLDTVHSKYLALLVEHNDTPELPVRKQIFTRLARMQTSRQKKLGEAYARFWTAAHHASVRELVGIGHFTTSDHARLGKLVIPALSPLQVEESLKLLRQLDLVDCDAKGVWKRSESVVSAGENWTTETIRSFQLSLMDLASRALVECPRDQRDISTLTITMSPTILEKVRSRIREFRQEILTLVRTDPQPHSVYHLTLQLFPASHPLESPRA